MDNVWIWTTAGWVEYLSCQALTVGDYGGGGTVGRSNLAVLDEDEALTRDNIDAFTDKAHGSRAPSFEGRTTDSTPEDVDVLVWNGWHRSKGYYLRADSERTRDYIAALEQYPLLDDSHHSVLEEQVQREAWDNASIRDRWDYLSYYLEKGAVSKLAARHDWATLWKRGSPDGTQFHDDNGALRDALTATY